VHLECLEPVDEATQLIEANPGREAVRRRGCPRVHECVVVCAKQLDCLFSIGQGDAPAGKSRPRDPKEDRADMSMEVPGCCGPESERPFHVQKSRRPGVKKIISGGTLSATRRQAGVDCRRESDGAGPKPKQAEGSRSRPFDHRGMGGADRERNAKANGHK
jgi:hypothetical protein